MSVVGFKEVRNDNKMASSYIKSDDWHMLDAEC